MIFTMEHKKEVLQRTIAVLCALLLWQVIAMCVDQRILLVSPIEVVKRLATIWREPGFWSTIWFSFCRIAGGFLLALVLGILLAALSGRYHLAEIMLRPYMVTVKTVPVASFVVICLIWLSVQRLSVFISFLIVLPVIYGNVLEGIKSEDKNMLEVSKVFRMPLLRRVTYIHLPQLKPFLLSACSTALGMAWKAGVAAEIIGTPDGSMGKQLYYAKIYLDTDDLLCWTVIIVLVSVLFEKLFMLLLRGMYNRLERG